MSDQNTEGNPQGEDAPITAQQKAEMAAAAAESAQAKAEPAAAASEAAKNRSEAAAAAAESAQAKAEPAATASEAAKNRSEAAAAAAEVAQGRAEPAATASEAAKNRSEAAATAAEVAQGRAEPAATASEAAKNRSEAAATAAETAQGGAEPAATASEAAKNRSEAAATAAEAAQERAEPAATASEAAKNRSEAAATATETAQARAEPAAIAAEAAQKKAEPAARASEIAQEKAETAANTAEDNLKELKATLANSITTSLGGAFQRKANKGKLLDLAWISVLTVGISGIIFIGYQRYPAMAALVQERAPVEYLFFQLLFGVASLSGPIWLSWVATKRLSRTYAISEDYAYKAALAQAYQGYRDSVEARDPLMQQRLFATVITQLDANPVRFLSDQHAASPLQDLLQQPWMESLLKEETFKEKFVAWFKYKYGSIFEVPEVKKE